MDSEIPNSIINVLRCDVHKHSRLESDDARSCGRGLRRGRAPAPSETAAAAHDKRECLRHAPRGGASVSFV